MCSSHPFSKLAASCKCIPFWRIPRSFLILGQWRLLVFLLLALAIRVQASVWYVDKDNSSGIEDGTSWATAFTKIQPAINAAEQDGGGEVWVAEGTYGEARISYPHGLDAGNAGSLIMREAVDLYGGFVGIETSRNQRNLFVPIANAGADRAQNVADLVALDGSISYDRDMDPITYNWTFTSIPAGSAATLSNPTTDDPSFVPDIAGDYVIQLVVSDGTFQSAPDSITISSEISGEGEGETGPCGGTITVHHGSSLSYCPGTDVDIQLTAINSMFETSECNLTALNFSVVLPDGWTYVGIKSGNSQNPTLPPFTSSGVISFGYITAPNLPVSFTFTIHAPLNATGAVSISGNAGFRTGGSALYGPVETITLQQSCGSGEVQDEAAHPTVINGATARGGQAAYHVIVGSSDAKLDGFTVIGGMASDDSVNYRYGNGGGMYNEGASPTINKCTFIGNISKNGGGGMYNESCTPTITNCSFSKNSAAAGGAIHNESSQAVIYNSRFEANSAATGGGVWNHYSSPTIEGCIFSLNTVTGSGGGIYNNRYSWPLIKQCSITSNRALDYGGGIANHDLCSPEITNCKFSANTAGGGGGIYNNSSSPMVKNCTFAAHWTFGSSDDVYNEGSTPRFSNCIFWFAGRSGSPIYADTSSNVEIKYSLVQGGFAGPGNINTDPQFVRNPSWLSHEIDYGDLQLQLDSPCNDAGTRSDAPATDFESTFRPQGSGIDIGAYELLHPALPIFTLNVAANGSGTITPPPGSYLVQSGSVITFSVLPSLNWLWSGWSGALEGLESSRTLVVSNNTTVIANFTELTAQGNLSAW